MDRDKLVKLRLKKAENNAKLHKELLDSNSSIKDAVIALHEAINSQEPINLDELTKQLAELKDLQTYSDDIKRFETALKESSNNEKLDDIIQAVGNINNKDVVSAVNDLIAKLEVKDISQSEEDYQPVRRVRKIGQRLVFDDDPLQVNVSGGGGSSIPVAVIRNSNSIAVSTDINKLNTANYVTDEDGIQSQMLGDTYFAGGVVMIDSAHHEIHCGDSILFTDVVDLTNSAVRDILFVVPNPDIPEKRYHFYIEVLTESEANYKLYESVITSNNGTVVSAFNRNRQDPVVPENEIVFTHTPTVTNLGTLIETEHWGSGRGVGGVNRAASEWVVKNNTKYLIRLTNATAVNNQVSLKVAYYVHPGV